MKTFRILGKRGRITVPYEIRCKVGFKQNDVLSFEESADGRTVVIKREIICDCNGEKSKEKKFDKNTCLLVFVLIFSGILIFLLLTASDNKKLNSTLNETFDFVKKRIERYEIYNTNDQVKSLVRLMDKTTELSRVIAQEGNLSEKMLDKYANE